MSFKILAFIFIVVCTVGGWFIQIRLPIMRQQAKTPSHWFCGAHDVPDAENTPAVFAHIFLDACMHGRADDDRLCKTHCSGPWLAETATVGVFVLRC